MGFGAHWERDKNAALVELDSRNRALQSKLSEAAKDEHEVSAEVRRMHDNIMHALHELQNESAKYASTTTSTAYVVPAKEPTSALSTSEVPVGTSVWEWQKNTALLELEHRNQELQSLLKCKDRRVALSEQDKELLQHGYDRGKECMRLSGQVQAMQKCLVRKAQRISCDRRLHAVISCWHRHSRRNKMLRKAEVLWDRRRLRKSLEMLTANQSQSKLTKKLKNVADRHSLKRMLLKTFQCWMFSISSKTVSTQRLLLFRVLQRSRSSRAAFGAWKCFTVSLAEKKAVRGKAERFSMVHRTCKVWRRWKKLVAEKQEFRIEAQAFFRYQLLARTLQTWNMNVYGSVEERSHSVRTEKHRRLTLLRRSLLSWHGISHLRAVQRRRLEKLTTSRIKRTSMLVFTVWKQRMEIMKEVRMWRTIFILKQKLQLRQRAFKTWSWISVMKKKLLRYQSQKATKTRLQVIRAWFRQSVKRKLITERMLHLRRRTYHKHLKEAFNVWLMHVEECRRLAVLRNAKLLQTQLELSQHDLHGAGGIRAEMIKLVRELEKEKRVMANNMHSVNARTPAWTSGFLDAELRWTSPVMSGNMPSARAGHITVALRFSSDRSSSFLVTGGYDGHSILSDIYIFHEADATWRIPNVVLKPGSAFPPPVRHHTACVHQGRVIIFGGFDGARDSDDLSVLTFSEDGTLCELSQPHWRTGIKPGPMSQHTSCLARGDTEMVVFGGYRATAGLLNELWVLDLQWMDWHAPEYTGEPPTPRRGHGAVILETKMYIFGGFDGKTNLADFYVLDLEQMHWLKVKTQGQLPSARRQHAMAVIGRHFLIYGGYDGEKFLEDVYSFDTEARVWKCWSVMKPETATQTVNYGRSMHTMVSSGHRLVIMGGVHEYGPEQDVLFLENGAAVDGLELQETLTEERNKAQTLQEQLNKCEEMLRIKVEDLAVAYTKVSQCQAALEVETKARKNAVAQEKILINKLRKSRRKASLW